jgi:hypothetical protein
VLGSSFRRDPTRRVWTRGQEVVAVDAWAALLPPSNAVTDVGGATLRAERPSSWGEGRSDFRARGVSTAALRGALARSVWTPGPGVVAVDVRVGFAAAQGRGPDFGVRDLPRYCRP